MSRKQMQRKIVLILRGDDASRKAIGEHMSGLYDLQFKCNVPPTDADFAEADLVLVLDSTRTTCEMVPRRWRFKTVLITTDPQLRLDFAALRFLGAGESADASLIQLIFGLVKTN